MTILVIQQILNGVPVDLIYPVDSYGTLNYSACLEFRDAFVERAAKFRQEIIAAECLRGIGK